MHPPPELINFLQDDDIPQALGELLLVNHLAGVCPGCEARLLALRQRAGDHFVERLVGIWSRTDTPVDERAAARQQLDALLDIPCQEERLRRIERAYSRFRSPVLVALALSEARSAIAADPDAAFRYAEIACAVARDGKVPLTSYALALAYAGNTRRAAGNLTAAQPFYAHAYDVLECCRETPHPWIVAEIASLEGSLLKDARLLDSAESCLLYAHDHFTAAGDLAGIARVLVKLSAVHRLAGQPRRAIEVIQQALDTLRGVTNPKLLLTALHSYVMFLSEDGDLDGAQCLLDHLSPLYAWYPEFEERHLWLRAKVARAKDQFDLAERLLRQAFQIFFDKGSPTYSALIALDLAELLLTTGRVAEVTTVTHCLPPLFRAQGVHDEATAATVLFHKAASQQALTRQLLSRLRSFFERSRRDPSLRFSPQ